jgi:hypothetical protein
VARTLSISAMPDMGFSFRLSSAWDQLPPFPEFRS